MEKQIIRNTKSHFSQLGLMFFLGTLIIVSVQTGVSVMVNMLFPDILGNADLSLIVGTGSMYLIGMPLLVLLVRMVPAVPIPRKSMKVPQLLSAFCISYALMYFSNLIGQFMTTFIGFLKGDSVANPIQDIVTELHLGTAILFTVICAPIIEEFIFRKLIIDRTSVKYGELSGILLSAFFFALFHGNLNQFVYAFTLGLLFGFVYAKTGMLRYSVLLHMGINFMGSVPGLLMLRSDVFQAIEQSASDSTALLDIIVTHPFQMILIGIYMALVMRLVIGGIVLFILSFKKFRCRPGIIALPKDKLLLAMLFNVGTNLYIGFWAIQIILQLFA